MSDPNLGPMGSVRRKMQLPVLNALKTIQAELAETQMILSSLETRSEKARRNIELLVMSIEANANDSIGKTGKGKKL